MVAASFYSHALTATVAICLTSGIWLTAYFAGVKPNSGGYTYNGATFNSYNSSSQSTNYNTYNTYNTNNYGNVNASMCQQPTGGQCGDTCEFVICESIPAGLQFSSSYKIYNTTTSCWMRLMSEAQNDILIGSYYWSLLVQDTGDNYVNDTTNTSGDGQLIYNTILATANRGVNIRIAQTYQEGGYPETTNLQAAAKNGKISVRSLNFLQWYPGGILHTKSWAVDGKHFYVGSANFDWRSLTQVKELGIAAFNCPCLAGDLTRLLEIYWEMGAPGAQLPQSWSSNYSAYANHQQPTSVPQTAGNQAVYFSASPPGFQSCGREDDLDAMIKAIEEADDHIYLAVMDYAPRTLYLKPNNFFFPRLDDALRRAAFDRGIKVHFMMSLWNHTWTEMFSYLHSLQDLSSQLPRVQINSTYHPYGQIEVRLIQVPPMQYGAVPYARVYHNKYFVTDKVSYVGTSNWSADYWLYTAGIGIIVRSDDVASNSFLVNNLEGIFLRDWNSNYTIPLNCFDNNGKFLNGTQCGNFNPYL